MRSEKKREKVSTLQKKVTDDLATLFSVPILLLSRATEACTILNLQIYLLNDHSLIQGVNHCEMKKAIEGEDGAQLHHRRFFLCEGVAKGPSKWVTPSAH